MAMDVKRDPKILKRKKMRRIALAVVGGAAVVAYFLREALVAASRVG